MLLRMCHENRRSNISDHLCPVCLPRVAHDHQNFKHGVAVGQGVVEFKVVPAADDLDRLFQLGPLDPVMRVGD